LLFLEDTWGQLSVCRTSVCLSHCCSQGMLYPTGVPWQDRVGTACLSVTRSDSHSLYRSALPR